MHEFAKFAPEFSKEYMTTSGMSFMGSLNSEEKPESEGLFDNDARYSILSLQVAGDAVALIRSGELQLQTQVMSEGVTYEVMDILKVYGGAEIRLRKIA